MSKTDAPQAKEVVDHELAHILSLLRIHTGHDFDDYKRNTLLRRIARRIRLHQLEDLPAYAEFLQENPAEVRKLFQEILIGVTNFFRDPEAFDHLKRKVIPGIVATEQPGQQVRVWIPGCSTGEEAYSIAILLLEEATARQSDVDIQIFATDMDDDALKVARAGVYPEGIATDVSSERLERFFVKEGSSYRVSKQVRELVIFAPHNLVKDPPFSRLDLLSCRNVMIYLDNRVQKKLIPLFHYALKPGGYLFLGTSESVGRQQKYFEPVSQKWRIFQRMAPAAKDASVLPFVDAGPRQVRKSTSDRSSGYRSIGDVTESILLKAYAPACVVVNEHYDIVHFHGRTGKYLEPASGQPSLNLLKMARQDLRPHLRRAIQKATRTRQVVVERSVSFSSNGTMRLVDLVVRPLLEPEAEEGALMVIFEDVAFAEEPAVLEGGDTAPAETVIHQLENDLVSTREALQATIEELETSNEELKSANEELLSLNEEFRSANAELALSQSELLSVNQELIAVNTELRSKIEELARASSDVSNLLGATDVGILFLDQNLRVKRFTSRIGELFNLTDDIKRPLGQVSHQLRYDRLLSDVESVLRLGTQRETEVQARNGRWYFMRLMPYYSLEGSADGVVLTFAEITAVKEAEAQLQQRFDRFQTLYQMANAVNHADKVEIIYEEALTGLQRTVYADRASVLLFDEEGVMRFVAWRNLSDGYRQATSGHSPWSPDASSPEPILVSDVKEAPELEALRETILGEGIRALGFIPLVYQGRLLGKFMVYYNRPHQFDEEEVQMAETIASYIAFAIERRRNEEALQAARAELEERVQERTAELFQANLALQKQVLQRQKAEEALQRESAIVRLLQEVAVAANTAGSVEEVLQFALDKLCAYTEWPLGHVYLVSPESELVSGGLWHCQDEDRLAIFKEFTAQPHFSAGVGWLGKMLQNAKAAWLNNVQDPDFMRNHRLQDLGIAAGFAFPVLIGAEVVGILEFYSPQPVEPDETLLTLVAHIGTQLGRVIERDRAEKKLAYTAQQLAAFNEMGQAVAASLDLNVIFARVLEMLRPLLSAEGVFILLPDRDDLVVVAGADFKAARAQGQRLPAAASLAGEVLRTGRTLWLGGDELRQRPSRVETLTGYEPETVLAVPLRLRGEVIGVMEAMHSQPNGFSDNDVQLLEAAAAWTAIAIGNARQHEALQRRLRESEAMAEISRALSETLDMERVLQLIVEAAQQIVPHVDWAVIHLLDWEDELLYPAAMSGLEVDPREYILRAGEGVAGRVVVEGYVVSVGDVQADARRLPLDEAMQVRSLLVAPVQSRTRRLGTISVHCAKPNMYLPDDERLLTTLGTQAAIAIENARLFKGQQRARQTAETLRAANMALTQTLNLEVVLEKLLDYLDELVDYTSADIMLLDHESVLRIRALRGYARLDNSYSGGRGIVDPRAYPLVQTILKQGESLIVADTADYPGWQPYSEGAGDVRSWMGVPLVAGGEVIGICALNQSKPHYFAEEHRVLAEALAAQAASALQNARLFTQIRAGRERLRKLTKQVVSAQEEERQRISRELHDEAGQALTALKISLDLTRAGLPKELEQAQQAVSGAMDLTDETMERIRLLAQGLRPPALDTLGLNLTLEGLCRDFANRTQLLVEYEGVDLPPLSDATTISLYRFVQEALTNVAKHAQATRVQVTLHCTDNGVTLSVADNGRGFRLEERIPSVQTEGTGLIGMYERFELLGGQLTIESELERGARLIAYVPLQEEER